MRTIINLEESQVSRLDAWPKTEKVSRAEAVRRAVDQMLERSLPKQGTGFGLWVQTGSLPPELDGLALQRAMRDEWPE